MLAALTLPSGRRAKFAVLAVWLAAMAVVFGGDLSTKYSDAERNESSSFLPDDAESTRELEAAERLTDGELAPMIAVYRRPGGLTAADRARIAADRAEFNRRRGELARLRDPELAAPFRATTDLGPPVFSPDRTGAILQAQITANGESETIREPVKVARQIISDPGGGLEAKVTGGAGFSADAIEVFEQINGTLIGAAFLLVLVLLALIYRSPFFLWIPLVVVAFAELATRGIGYGLTEAGITINGQSSSILSVLVLGAGTDYALLLVARYREELRKHEDRHEAMALALRTAGPAIVASGSTVIAALLVLSLADVNSTAALGPIGAVGIATAMVSMLTLLPAILMVVGRFPFWPRIPHFGDEGADETHGAWRRVGDRVARGPRRVWIGTAAVLAVMALGLLNFDDGLTQGNGFTKDVESVEGQALLSQSFPGGANAPTEIFVPDPARAGAVQQAVARTPGVAAVFPADRGEEGVLLNAVLEPEPFTTEAFDLIPGIRRAAKEAGGPETLVGGPTAIERDLRKANVADSKLIMPLTLVVVFVVLVVLLRALVAPVLLMATVLLSFLAALGVGSVVFDVVFGFPGASPDLPLFAFIFLVALGIDYNIFLMARVREETMRHGTRQGMLRGLAVTGGVITSAGIVLAGTFSVLAVLPLVFLTEIGFVIAFGVLLDTFLVRSVLVPALVLDIGPRSWWPSRLAREDDERRAPPEEPEAVPAGEPVA